MSPSVIMFLLMYMGKIGVTVERRVIQVSTKKYEIKVQYLYDKQIEFNKQHD